jgi:hypothetical protein
MARAKVQQPVANNVELLSFGSVFVIGSQIWRALLEINLQRTCLVQTNKNWTRENITRLIASLPPKQNSPTVF